MPIIKLHKRVYSKETDKAGYFIPIGWEPILFNTDMIITIDEKNGWTHVKYKEALVNGFTCRETMDEILNLIDQQCSHTL